MTEKVVGMEIGDPKVKVGERNIDCADCLRGTQYQLISRYPFTKATRPLERVSADIAGPMKIQDFSWGYKYLLVIIDHYTRYTWVFPLITKGMALQAMRIFKKSAENQSGLRLLILQTDNAGEFMSKEWVNWIQEEGIDHITCAPYGSSMNSYIERLIKDIIYHASAMLWHAGVREDFWALAAKCSTYLHNCAPNKSLDGEVTPYQMWYGKKPHL